MPPFLNKLFKLNPLKLSLILALALAVVYLFGLKYVEIMELKARDLRFQIRGQIEPGPEVALAVVDEKSLDELGRWPWPRATIARLIQTLDAGGAKVIGFDIGFLEPDHNTNIAFIERLEKKVGELGMGNQALAAFFADQARAADNDLALAQAIENAQMKVVLGYFLRMERDETVAHVTEEQIEDQIGRLKNSSYTFLRAQSQGLDEGALPFAQAFMPVAAIEKLANAAAASGYMNMFQDVDGTTRWLPLVIRLRGVNYLPLSLLTLKHYLGVEQISIDASSVGAEDVRLGDHVIPTDEIGRILVNYRGPGRTFPHYSIADILSGDVPAETFKNKIILCGATAVGIYDMRITPFENDSPGLEVHANVIDSILRDDYLVKPQWAGIFDIMLMLAMALALGFTLPRLKALAGLGFALGLFAISNGLNYYFFLQGRWLNLVYPTITIVTVYTGITIFRYITEEREKRKIKGMFQTYVTPSVVKEMMENPDALKLGGDKKHISVLFSDIAGFTTISESMDSVELVTLVNRYLTAMTSIVFENEGTLDKYIGDAVMAVYGAPLSYPDHALKACRTALGMMREVRRLRQVWAAEDPAIPYIDHRIGINSGIMVAGNMGSEQKFDYTVIGDGVNLGARLEGTNKQYGTNIIISEFTYEQVQEEMFCRELDLVAVKGKSRPVRIFELLGENGQVSEDDLNLTMAFSHGLAAYHNRDWERAKRIFTRLVQRFPKDQPSRLYLARVNRLAVNPPPEDWNGVFVMTTK